MQVSGWRREGHGDWVMWDQEKAVRRADCLLGPRRGVKQRSDVENRWREARAS